MIRPGLDTVMMAICDCLAFRGMCKRLHVATVIVLDKRIISSGINGPSTWDCDELKCDIEKPCAHAKHAEENAVMFSRKHGINIEGATMYITHQPCPSCAELIVESKISRIVYSEPYRILAGLEYLLSNQIIVDKFEKENV